MEDLNLCWSDDSGDFLSEEINDEWHDNDGGSIALQAEAEDMLEKFPSKRMDSNNQVFDTITSSDSSQQPELVGAVASIVDKLPTKLAASASENTLSLTANDFSKLLKLLPESLPGGKTDVSGLKRVCLEGNKLRFDGKMKIELPMDGINVPLLFEDFSADLKADPDNPNKIILTNIKGLKAESLGVVVHLQELSLSLRKNGDRMVAIIEIPKLNAVASPGPLQLLVKDKVAELNKNKIAPVELPLQQDTAGNLQKVVAKLHEWASKKDSEQDASLLMKDLIAVFARQEVSLLLQGITGIERDGDNLTITTNGEGRSIGGLPLKFDKKLTGLGLDIEKVISARVSTDGGKVELRNIQGIKLTLPAEVAKATGLEKLNLSIEDLVLSAPDKNGNRVVSLKMGGFIETVHLKMTIGPDMAPVPVDHDGNVAVKIEMKNGPKLLCAELVFNPEGAEGKTKCVYAQLFKRAPDYPGCKWMIEKFESGASFKEVMKLAIANEAREFKNALPQNKAEIVPFLYQRILNRPYGPGEDNGLHAKLLEENGVDAVIESLMESSEFKNNHPDIRAKVCAVEGADDVAAFIEKLRGRPLDKTMKDVLSGVRSFAVQNDKRLALTAKEPRQIGDLPLFADASVSLLLSASSFAGEIRATDVKGLKIQLPLPGDVLSKLQCPADAPLKAVAVVPAENDNRLIQVDFEHPIFKQVAFIVDSSGKPLIEGGRIRARVRVDVGGKAADCYIDLPAEQKPGAQTSISFKGDPAARVELLKRLGTPSEFSEVAGEVAGISIIDASVVLHFNKPTSVNMKGLSMRFDKNVVITAHKPQKIGFGQFAQDVQGFSVQGVEVSGFEFRGSQWQQVGSTVLNQYLRDQNDLPIRISSLYFGTSPNDQQLRVGFFADQGIVKHAQFTLESRDNPTFVDGSVTLKNPFRNLSPTARLWNNDYEMTVRLNQDGLQKPAATIRDTASPILDDPILRFLPPVQIIRTGLAAGELIESLFDW